MTGNGWDVREMAAPLVLLLELIIMSDEATLTEICPEGKTGDLQETSLDERDSAATVRFPKPLSKIQNWPEF
jgi:hypothetical protein